MSVRNYAILWNGAGKASRVATMGGGNSILDTAQHSLDGSEHTAPADTARLDASTTAHGLMPKGSGDAGDVYRGDLSQSPVTAEELQTVETDTTKRLAPDGLGGVAFASGGAGVTYGTPALALGTANAAGSTNEAIRRDATILTFDATVPTTQAFGDAAAAGSAPVAARRDHKHAMPADPAGASGTPTFSGYTPALTAVTTNPTLGSGSFAGGRYAQIGRVVIGNAFIGFGTAGVGAGSGEYRISLPVAGNFSSWLLIGNGYVFDSSAGLFRAVSLEPLTSMTVRLAVDNGIYIAHNGPWAWAASDQLRIHFSYEAA